MRGVKPQISCSRLGAVHIYIQNDIRKSKQINENDGKIDPKMIENSIWKL